MQADAIRPLPLPSPGSIDAGFLSGRRANAPVLVLLAAPDRDQLEPTDASSAGEGSLSRKEVDRARSNIGPAPVQIAACDPSSDLSRDLPFDLLRARLGPGYLKRVSNDLDVPHGTAKKWFLGQNRPSFERRLKLWDRYGDLLREDCAA